MSEDEIKKLKTEILELRSQLQAKTFEVSAYQKELLKFSQKLDQLMTQSNDDIQVLNQIHKFLAPTELPQFPGFEFSRKFVYGSKFGGDYFDIFEHEDKMKFGVLISSATGYAMSALMLSIVLKLSHIMEAKKGMSPSKVMEHLGTELKQLATEKDKAQVLYAVIDRREWTFNFCAVGKIQGFFQVPDGQMQLISSDSDGLGPVMNPKYSEIKLNLEPKTKIVLITEGLMDVLTRDEIAQIIQNPTLQSPHDLRNDLLVAAQVKSGLETPQRDQTVVVIEVKDNIIKLAKS
jgi:sigma-B regulation protein RsbU (phosphoserine phosphatase)